MFTLRVTLEAELEFESLSGAEVFAERWAEGVWWPPRILALDAVEVFTEVDEVVAPQPNTAANTPNL